MPLIVVWAQKLFAFAYESLNVTGIQVWAPDVTLVAVTVGAVQVLFWRVAGATQARAVTVSTADVLLLL